MRNSLREQEWLRFKEAACHVCSTWTALRLATDQGWGGRDSVEKAEQFVSSIILFFEKPFHNGSSLPIEPEDLADELSEHLETLFSVELDDFSHKEVSQLLCNLYVTCLKNDFSLANQILQLRSADGNVTQNPSDSDETESLEDPQDEPPIKPPSPKQIPDNDGWITIPQRHKAHS